MVQLGSESLGMRNLRFHYGGNLKETGQFPFKQRCYVGGAIVDSKDWDGDEIFLGDLEKEAFKLIPIPKDHDVVFSWFCMKTKDGYINQKLPIENDIDIMTMWETQRPTPGNILHLYVEFKDKDQNSNFVPPPPNTSLDFNSTHYPQSQTSLDFILSEAPPLLNQVHSSGPGIEPVKKYLVTTRSKGKVPNINIDRCDAEEDYESPCEYSGSEEEDDEELREDEIEWAKNLLATDAREYALRRAEERERLVVEKAKKIQQECESTKGKEKVNSDLEWIQKTSRIDDYDGCEWPDMNLDEEGLPVLEVDQRWYNIYKCRSYLKTYAIRRKFVLGLIKNDSDRIQGCCKGVGPDGESCSWYCSIGRMNDKHTMRVGVLHKDHTCVSYELIVNRTVNAPWIAEQIESDMRMHHRTYKARNIMSLMWEKFQLDIKYWQAWHALTLALELIHGNYEDSYKKIPELCKQILMANPGSIVKCSRNVQFGMFENFILCFKASIDGFVNGCRPLIGLDGCFLKGKYGGCCLCIVALDGNNGMFPLAIFICVRENMENWSKNLEFMSPYLLQHREKLTIMSDRQKGFDASVAKYFPNCHQRYCFRHMTANMKKYYKGVNDLAWLASKAYAKSWFDHNMEEMGKCDPGAVNYLMEEDLSKWARHAFHKPSKSEHTTNNWSEAFNARILEARDKPIVGLVTTVMDLLMKLQYERRNTAKTWPENGLVPRVLEILELNKKKMGEFQVFGSDEKTYKVMNLTRSMWWNVDLQAHFCTCCEWQLTGIPCVHAVRVLSPLRPDWKMYCSEYFSVETYKAVYSGTIKPILHETDWSKSTGVDILPPVRPIAPGRPPVARRRGIDEGPARYNCKKQFRCGICKGYGHNKLTCTGGGPNYVAMMVAMEDARKGATPRGGRPKTRPRKPGIGEPLEAAYATTAAEEMMEQEQHMATEARRGRGKGRGKVKEKSSQQPGFMPQYMPCYMPHYMPGFVPQTPLQPRPQFIPQMPSSSSVPSPPPSSSEFYMIPPPPPSRQVLRPSTFTSNEFGNPRVFNSTLASLLGYNQNQQIPSQGSNNISSQRGTSSSQPTQQSKTTMWMPRG